MQRWHRHADLAKTALAHPGRLFLTLFGLFFAMLLAWGLGTPLQQAPDEWAHLYRAASIYDGQILISAPGQMDPTLGDPVRVPGSLVADRNAAQCFMHRNLVPVSCSHPKPTSDALVLTSTPASRYPPFYYLLVGWPLLFGHGAAALYLMRVVAAAVSAVFLAWGMLSVFKLRAGLAATGMIVAVTPMVAWLATMINPNGLEIAAAVALWPQLLLWVTAKETRLRRAGALGAAAAAATMVLARSVSIIWVCVAVISMIPLMRLGWLRTQLRNRSTYFAVGGVVLAGVITLAWSAISRQTELGPRKSRGYHVHHDSLWHNVGLAYDQLPRWWHQAIGDFGWLDTPISDRAVLLYELVLVLLVGWALIRSVQTRGFSALAAAVIAAGFTLIVTLYLSASVMNKLSVEFWQGRYSLPMAVGVPLLLGYAAPITGRKSRWLTVGVSLLASAAISLIALRGFLGFFQRNSVGLHGALSLRGGWQPPGGIVLWLVILTLSLLGLAVVAVLGTVGGITNQGSVTNVVDEQIGHLEGVTGV